MPFNLYDALAGGLWATTAFTAFMTLMLALGLVHIDFGRLLGGIFMPKLDRSAAVAGLVVNFVVGLIFALIYAGIFAYVGMGPTLWLNTLVGAGFGIYHWVLSMPLISAGRLLNKHVARGEEPDPGIWGIHFGPQEAFFRLVGHVIFGAVMGFSYFAIALLNGSASGAGNGNGVALILALVLAAAVVYLYASWLPAPERERAYVFAASEPSDTNLKFRAREELRHRYERGELSWDEYQHERQAYASEP